MARIEVDFENLIFCNGGGLPIYVDLKIILFFEMGMLRVADYS